MDEQGGQHKVHFTLLLTDLQNKTLSQVVKVMNTELLTLISIINVKKTEICFINEQFTTTVKTVTRKAELLVLMRVKHTVP